MTRDEMQKAAAETLAVLDITSSLGIAVVHCIQALEAAEIHTACTAGVAFVDSLRQVISDGEAKLTQLYDDYLELELLELEREVNGGEHPAD